MFSEILSSVIEKLKLYTRPTTAYYNLGMIEFNFLLTCNTSCSIFVHRMEIK